MVFLGEKHQMEAKRMVTTDKTEGLFSEQSFLTPGMHQAGSVELTLGEPTV